MKRFFLPLMALVVIAMIAVAASSSAFAASDTAGQCDGYQNAVEAPGGSVTVDGVLVNVTISGSHVDFTDANGNPIEVTFCVHASNANSGVVGPASSYDVNFENNGGQIPDISNVVVYTVSTPEVVEVTPVPPVMTAATCDTAASVTIPDQPEGVLVDVQGSLTGPGSVTITFSADEGFVIAEGAQTVFTFDLAAATGDCGGGGGNPPPGGGGGTPPPSGGTTPPPSTGGPSSAPTVAATTL